MEILSRTHVEKKMEGSVDLDALKKKDNASTGDDVSGSKPGEGDAPNSGKDDAGTDAGTDAGSTTPTTPPSSGNTDGGDSEEA